jgi:hypothetical protein
MTTYEDFGVRIERTLRPGVPLVEIPSLEERLGEFSFYISNGLTEVAALMTPLLDH